MQKLYEELIVHKYLNPAIWTKENTILPEVQEQLLKIIDTFKSKLEVPIHIVDARLVGSNASFNYTNTSDLDLHLIINFEDCINDQFIRVLYKTLAKDFCNKYSIFIHNIEVEIYIEDMESQVNSNGIYSIFNQEWIKFPKPITDLPVYDFTQEISKIENCVNKLIKDRNLEGLQDQLDSIYLMRKNCIQLDGEYSKGNQLFKELRNLGVIKRIKDTITELTAKELTLEQLQTN